MTNTTKLTPNLPHKLLKKRKYQVKTVEERDSLIPLFAQRMLAERYLIPGEKIQDMFARVSSYYADDEQHAQRLYDYMSQLWFMPATPVLSNGGTERGLPISCFLNEVDDSLHGIVDTWNENVWLASRGGGIGTYWGNVRSIGENVKGNGKTSGIIPFICVQDRMTLAISQGNLRRGSAAVYLPVSHPEIEEFIEMRRPTGGDRNRKALNMHHGVVIPDSFMEAVINDEPWALKSPKDNSTVRLVKARDLWIRILTTRLETGEPYILFIDHVNKSAPEVYKKLGLKIKTSNLCSEITLATGKDHKGKKRTAVCCLSSVNLEFYEEWEKNPQFIADIMRFLDNVLQDFIDNADPVEHGNAIYSAARERSVGLGTMGFHSFLQERSIPVESVVSKSWNLRIFRHIKQQADAASQQLATERGACPDAEEAGIMERFSNKIAVAPNASIANITGCSPSIELIPANIYTKKGLDGSDVIRNEKLAKVLEKYGKNEDSTWNSIINNDGSIQHLTFLSQNEKDVFKTAFEVDQRWLIDLAGERTPYICQAQSLNIFLLADIHKKTLHEIHLRAWQKGIKSLYYMRSKSIQQPDRLSILEEENRTTIQMTIDLQPEVSEGGDKYEECLSCQ